MSLTQKNAHKKGNSAKDAIGRYCGLQSALDRDVLNSGWFETDIARLNSAQSDFHFIDLFSGAGGLSLGFRQGGFRKVFSVEIDKDASRTIRANFPESVHYEGKIEEVSNTLVREMIGGRTIHIVCGGPPCQGFSVAGLRNPNDPRNQMFREFIRIVGVVRPWYVVMENVPGILTMRGGDVRREIIRQFKDVGYHVSVRILEAATFGAPQLRARAVFVGNRLGRQNPYPAAQFARENYKAIESAIDDLKNTLPNPAINHEWTRHSEKMKKRLAAIPPGGSLYSTFRDAWKRQHRGVPSMAVKENHGGVHVHYEKNRVLSAREMARLQTFPDDFIFSGTMKRAYWQIGNAVPCVLAKSIALAVRSELEKAEKAAA